jgi:hypothetical protein
MDLEIHGVLGQPPAESVDPGREDLVPIGVDHGHIGIPVDRQSGEAFGVAVEQPVGVQVGTRSQLGAAGDRLSDTRRPGD